MPSASATTSCSVTSALMIAWAGVVPRRSRPQVGQYWVGWETSEPQREQNIGRMLGPRAGRRQCPGGSFGSIT